MNAFARTYWFTWGFLVLAAAFTGVASLKDAFFGGLFAAVLSAALTRVYGRTGVRFAPLLGAAAGALWVWLTLLRLRWFGDAEELGRAQWTLGVDITVHAAGFAGAGLLTALLARTSFARAAWAGLGLAAAMTAVPYGLIAWIDHQVAGPVEVVLLVSPPAGTEGTPYRAPGAVVARLNAGDTQLLKERLLVVPGADGEVVLDDQGRRYWPLWRRRLAYPGNPGGPVRTVCLLLDPDLTRPQTWSVPVPRAPDGHLLAVLDSRPAPSVASAGLSQAVRLEVSLKVQGEGVAARPAGLDIKVIRRSPVADFYVPVPFRDLSAAFPLPPVPVVQEPPPARLLPAPRFTDAPGG